MVTKYKPMLEEGQIYKIQFLIVFPNSCCYKATPHENRVIFSYKTIVSPMQTEIIPLNALSLLPCSELLKQTSDLDVLVDFIGLLTSVSSEREYQRDGKVAKMKVIELTDQSGTIECALFGDYVQSFNALVGHNDMHGVVVLVQFVKLKIYKGKPGLQNVLYTTRILFNPEISEALEFRRGIAGTGLLEQYPIPVFEAGHMNPSLEDDFMRITPKKAIGQLLNADQDGFAIVLATIVDIVSEGGWFYAACNRCHRAVKLRGMFHHCDSCDSTVLNALPRYKLFVEVVDGIDAAVFVLCDEDAEMLLQRSCASLMTDLHEGCNESANPKLFHSLIGKKMLFKVGVGPSVFSNSNSDGSFSVRRVCNDDTIISMFLLDGADVTPEKAVFTPLFKYESVAHESEEFEASSFGCGVPSTSGHRAIEPTMSTLAKRNLSEAFHGENVAKLGLDLKVPKIDNE